MAALYTTRVRVRVRVRVGVRVGLGLGLWFDIALDGHLVHYQAALDVHLEVRVGLRPFARAALTHPRTVHLARCDVACGGRHVLLWARCRLWCTTRCAVCTARPRLVRVRRTYSRGKPGQAALRLRYVLYSCGTVCMCHGSRTRRGHVNTQSLALRLRYVWRGTSPRCTPAQKPALRHSMAPCQHTGSPWIQKRCTSMTALSTSPSDAASGTAAHSDAGAEGAARFLPLGAMLGCWFV